MSATDPTPDEQTEAAVIQRIRRLWKSASCERCGANDWSVGISIALGGVAEVCCQRCGLVLLISVRVRGERPWRLSPEASAAHDRCSPGVSCVDHWLGCRVIHLGAGTIYWGRRLWWRRRHGILEGTASQAIRAGQLVQVEPDGRIAPVIPITRKARR